MKWSVLSLGLLGSIDRFMSTLKPSVSLSRKFMSIVDRPWKVVVRQPSSGGPLYVGVDGRPVLAEWFGPGVITSTRPFSALIDGQELQITGETPFEQRAQFFEECQGALLVHSPAKPTQIEGALESTTQVDSPGWITAAEADVDVDGLGTFSPDLIRLGPIPVLDFASCAKAFDFVPVSPEAFNSVRVEAENLRDSPILKSIKNTSAPISVPDHNSAAHISVMQLNDMVFQIDLDQGQQTIVIDRLYDRFHGKQRARVSVWSIPEKVLLHDGIWYEPQEDRLKRVANSRYAAILSATSSSVQVVIAPPSGAPLWSMIKYRFRTFL